MPSFISHGIIGYLLFGTKGIIYGILPDILAFSHYSVGLIQNYKDIPFHKNVIHWVPQSSMQDIDWCLYRISHSLIFWFIVYTITGDKAVYAAIFAILMDIFLHKDDIWPGPQFLYPLSNYVYNGIHWFSVLGMVITVGIIVFLYRLPQQKIDDFINRLP